MKIYSRITSKTSISRRSGEKNDVRVLIHKLAVCWIRQNMWNHYKFTIPGFHSADCDVYYLWRRERIAGSALIGANINMQHYYYYYYYYYITAGMGHAVAQLVEPLCYMPEGRGFDSRWCLWSFPWHHPSGCTLALGSTQPLTEMSSRNISWGVKAAGV